MLRFESDYEFRKVALWNNEIPFDYISSKEKHMEIKAGKGVWHEGTICMEAKLNHGHASNYAMVCIKYTYRPSQTTEIIIHYGNCRKNTGMTGLYNKNAIVGLDEFFANIIYKFFEECPSETIPGGVVEVVGGAYDEIGSSYMSFKCVIETVIWIFSNYKKISEKGLGEEILNRIRDSQHSK